MLSIITRREMQGTNHCDNLKKLLETTNQIREIIMDFFFFFFLMIERGAGATMCDSPHWD